MIPASHFICLDNVDKDYGKSCWPLKILFVICFVRMLVIFPVRASYNFVTHYRGYAEQMMLRSPEIRMRITDQGGDDIRTAMVSIYNQNHYTLSCFHFNETSML